MAQKLENIAPLAPAMMRALVLMDHGRLHVATPKGGYKSNADPKAQLFWPSVIRGLRDRHLVLYSQGSRYVSLSDLGKQALKQLVPRMCRRCGCTEDRACKGGCSWADRDLCTACQ